VKRVAVLISGGGSNLQALIDACAASDFPAKIALVISNHADAFGLQRARDAAIATTVVSHRDFATRQLFEAEIQSALVAHRIELVCLAGFMRVLTAEFVVTWRGRMLNIHPSLLPSFKGLHTHARAIEAGVKFHGCTVHFVEPELDDGPIIAQACVPVLDDDTAEILAARVLLEEHRLYPEALRLVASGQVQIVGRRVLRTRAESMMTL
jgi:phosphoribosylglycinamide formyltransferase 1